MTDALTPEEEVAAVHTHIKLAADADVWYDNRLTGLREHWQRGVIVSTGYMADRSSWLVEPNPWIVSQGAGTPRASPY